jgi:hypothetical protein
MAETKSFAAFALLFASTICFGAAPQSLGFSPGDTDSFPVFLSDDGATGVVQSVDTSTKSNQAVEFSV